MRHTKLLALAILGTLLAAGSTWADYKIQLTLKLGSNGSIAGESYLLSVPDSLVITTNGWNFIGCIKVSQDGDNAFDTAKQLVVSALSSNDQTGETYALKYGDESISYTIKAVSKDEDAATAEKTTTFTFTAAEVNSTGTSKPIGITVTWDDSQAAGTYEDYIVYTAKVTDALLSLTVDGSELGLTSPVTFYYVQGETWAQAIDNHQTENENWSTETSEGGSPNSYVLYVGVAVLTDGTNNVLPTATIDSSLSYVLTN